MEVPEVKVVDKIVEVPSYEYQYKYVPKIETQENVIQRPKYETKYVEKIVEVPQIKEVVRYQDVEEVEEVIRCASTTYCTRFQKLVHTRSSQSSLPLTLVARHSGMSQRAK